MLDNQEIKIHVNATYSRVQESIHNFNLGEYTSRALIHLGTGSYLPLRAVPLIHKSINYPKIWKGRNLQVSLNKMNYHSRLRIHLA